MQWFRMYGEFANDPKVQMLSEANQRRLVMLFCLRCNDDVTLQDEEVTFQLRISVEEWASTKAEFVRRGFIDNDNNILNWNKRQFVSDDSNQRVKRHREKMKRECNVTVTPQNRTEQSISDTEQKVLPVAVAPVETPKPRGMRLEAYLEQNGIETVCQEFGKWSLQQGMTAEQINWEMQKFRDWWKAVAGAKGVKLDWPATWRTWCRSFLEKQREQERRNAVYQNRK